MSASRARWLSVALLAVVFIIPINTALRPAFDWDIWWHLRTGEWIVENSQVPETDPFSDYGRDQSWLAYSWLFEVFVYGVYNSLGLSGLVLYRAAMMLLIAVSFQRLASRQEPRVLASTLYTLLGIFAVLPLAQERPWLFTILFTTWTLVVVQNVRQGQRSWTIWALPAVFVLWANIHIQFVYGFLILGLAWVCAWIERDLASFRRLTLLGTFCALATLVNPYHFRLYGVVLEYATQTGAFSTVSELMAPTFRMLPDWVVLTLGLATAIALGRSARVPVFELLLLCFGMLLWARARRDMWMVVLPALLVLPRRLSLSAELSFAADSLRQLRLMAAMLAAGLGVLLWFGKGIDEERMREVEAKQFPKEAAELVTEKGWDGPLYNSFDYGGYLIWKVPHLRVNIDGRTNLHGDWRIERSLAVWKGYKDWDKDKEFQRAQLIFAETNSALAALLRRSEAEYRVLHQDEQAWVFQRR